MLLTTLHYSTTLFLRCRLIHFFLGVENMYPLIRLFEELGIDMNELWMRDEAGKFAIYGKGHVDDAQSLKEFPYIECKVLNKELKKEMNKELMQKEDGGNWKSVNTCKGILGDDDDESKEKDEVRWWQYSDTKRNQNGFRTWLHFDSEIATLLENHWKKYTKGRSNGKSNDRSKDETMETAKGVVAGEASASVITYVAGKNQDEYVFDLMTMEQRNVRNGKVRIIRRM